MWFKAELPMRLDPRAMGMKPSLKDSVSELTLIQVEKLTNIVILNGE
jgi:hypothetical protein